MTIPDIITLHRYFIWANRMKEHFENALLNPQWIDRCKNKPLLVPVSFFADDPGIFMSYWYGALHVVIEGWNGLRFSDPEIDQLLNSPNIDLLRRYRNGVFHFQKNYFDNRFDSFMDEQTSVQWTRDLHQQFGEYFLREMQESKGSVL